MQSGFCLRCQILPIGKSLSSELTRWFVTLIRLSGVSFFMPCSPWQFGDGSTPLRMFFLYVLNVTFKVVNQKSGLIR